VKSIIVISIILMSLLLPEVIFCQSNPSPIQFHGSVSSDVEYTFRNGADLDREPFAWNIGVSPRLDLWGLQLDFNINLSSYDVDFRQAFNRYKFGVPSFFIPDLNLNLDWLELQLLDANPSYSDYSISGLNVRGAAFDLKPGNFRLSGVWGQIQRGVESSDTSDVAYRRMIYAVRLGIGKEDESHLHLHFLKARDDSTSIHPFFKAIIFGENTDSVEIIAPIENSVFSIEPKLDLFEGKLSLEGEAAVAAYNRDMRANPITVDEELVNWMIPGVFQPRMTSQIDWASKGNAKLALGSTNLGFEFEQVGWGFESIGIYFLPQDTRTFSADFSQTFSNPFTISINTSAEYSRDNLDGMKPVTTITRSGTANLGVYPQNFPSLTVGYAPYGRTAPEDSEGLSGKVDDITHTIWGSSSYNFKVAERSQSLGLSISANKTEDRVNPDNNLSTFSTNLYANHQLNDMFSLDWDAGWTDNGGEGANDSYNLGIGTEMSLLENKCQNSFDLSYQKTVSTVEDKLSLRLKSGVKLFDNFSIDGSAEYATYNSTNSEDYDEFVMGMGVNYNW